MTFTTPTQNEIGIGIGAVTTLLRGRHSKVLIAEPLVVDHVVSTKMQAIMDSGFAPVDLADSRQAHVVLQGTDSVAARRGFSRGHDEGNGITGIGLFAHEFFPFAPENPIGHKEKEGVQVEVVHYWEQRGSQPREHGRVKVEGITR